MDWQFITDLLKGVLWSSNYTIQKVAALFTYISFLSYLSLYLVSLVSKMKDKLLGARKYAAYIFLGFVLINVILTSYSMYENQKQLINDKQLRIDNLQNDVNDAKIQISYLQQEKNKIANLASKPTQWYLKINNVTSWIYDADNDIYIPNLSFRIFPIINDKQKYSYPTKPEWIKLQAAPVESFPIPVDEEPYRIKFEGLENSNSVIPMIGTKEDIFEVNTLPSKEQTYKIIKNDSRVLDPNKTTITIHYEIVNHK